MSRLSQMPFLITTLFLLFTGTGALAGHKAVVIPLDDDQTLKNVVTVAKAYGDFTDPAAALDSIGNASADNPYVVAIGPGVYSLTRTLVMKAYVDIVGKGAQITKLQGALSTTNSDASSALVSGANNAALRSLSVKNTGASTYSIGLYNNNASPTISNVTLEASGGSDSYGVYNYASSPTMSDVIAIASGAENSYGIYNAASSSPLIRDVTATASGGTTTNNGIRNSSSSSTMSNVTATASGGMASYGVYNSGSSSPTMDNIDCTATGGTLNYGVYNSSSSPRMSDVAAAASGGLSSYGVYNSDSSSPTMTRVSSTASGGGQNYGVYSWNSSAPIIRRSNMAGSTCSLYTVSPSTATVSQSTIAERGGVGGNGTNKCIACDNGSGTALDADCL